MKKYDEKRNQIEEAYFGPDGRPFLHQGGYAMVTYQYDPYNRVIETAYWGVDGKPTGSTLGYARSTCRRDEKGESGGGGLLGREGETGLVFGWIRESKEEIQHPIQSD